MHHRARRIVPVVVIVTIVAVGAYWFFQQQAAAEGPTSGSGTVEAESLVVAPEVAGRVVEVLADEGEAVAVGDPLVRLDGATLAAQRTQAEAAAAAAEAAQRAAEAEVALLEAGPSAEQVAVAQAAVDRARVTADALRDQYRDLTSAAEDTAAGKALKARRDAARAAVRQAEAQLALVRAGARAEQVVAARMRAEAAAAQAAAARATLDLLDAQIAKLTIAAPIAGTVLTRVVDPGAFVAPGSALMELADLGAKTITVYVAEDRYGQLALGQQAEVTTDSYSGESFTGTIVRIADEAEFTPRNVQTPDGRRSTVYAIRLALEDPEGKLKPGMPADVRFPFGTQ